MTIKFDWAAALVTGLLWGATLWCMNPDENTTLTATTTEEKGAPHRVARGSDSHCWEWELYFRNWIYLCGCNTDNDAP